jgi:hypothetical protein
MKQVHSVIDKQRIKHSRYRPLSVSLAPILLPNTDLMSP